MSMLSQTMKLCSQSFGTLQSRIIAEARSRIMVAPVSPAAPIIATTVCDGPAALPNFIFEMVFFAMSIVIGMGGHSWTGTQGPSHTKR